MAVWNYLRMLSSPAGLYLVLPMFAFALGLLRRGYPSISPHREQKTVIALSSRHGRLSAGHPDGGAGHGGLPPSPLQKLPVDPARLRLQARTGCLLRQQIWTVASHRLAPVQPTLFSAVPKGCFQAAREHDAASVAGRRQAGIVSLPRSPRQGQGGTRAGAGGA